MKKYVFLIFALIILVSCSQVKEQKLDINKNPQQKIEIKDNSWEINQSWWINQTSEKFDKKYSRKKEFYLPNYLCREEKISDLDKNVTVNTKNCLWIKDDSFINFSFSWNFLTKNINWNSEKILQIHKNAEKKNSIKFINNIVIKKFKNELDIMYCRVANVTKNVIIIDKNTHTFVIEPVWFYKVEAKKQIQKDSKTPVCEWYYNPKKVYFLSNIKKNMIVEVIYNDTYLIDLKNIKFIY